MAVVGAAQILVRPSFAGFQTAARKQMPGFGAAAGSAYAGGFAKPAQAATRETFGSKAARGLKVTAQATGAAVGGILAFAITKGFSRLNAIERAQAKLRGLGHDAKSIQGIMTSALASVKGTAFGLDEAATAAASAVAAGIKPGRELTKYLKLTADAATIAGVSFKDMGSIINQVTTAGKAQTDDLNQLADRGIPIYQWLAKEYKVSAIGLRDMVKKGKVDSATFRKVIEENIGGAALATGDTTQGAFKNMQASLGRVGANLLSGVFPQLRAAFVGITAALGPVEDKSKVVGKALGNFIGFVSTQFRKYGPGVLDSIKQIFASLKSGESGSLGDSFRRIGASFVAAAPAVTKLSEAMPSFASGLKVAADWSQKLADHTSTLAVILGVLAAAVIAHKAAQVANNLVGRNSIIGFGAQIVSTQILAASNRRLAASNVLLANGQQVVAAATERATVATVAQSIAQRAAGAASKIWAAGQWLVNAAMYANPIGLVVVAIAALVAGVILAYKHSETFRRIVQAAWSGIKIAAEATWLFLRDKVWPVILTIFRSIGDAATWLWQKAIKPAVDFIVAAWTAVGRVVSAVWNGFLRPVLELTGAIIVWLAKKVFAVNVAIIQTVWKALGTAFRWVYDNVIKRVIDWFTAKINAFRTAWQIVTNALKTAWSIFAAQLKLAYDRTIAPVVVRLGDLIKWLREKVWNPVIGGLKSAWSTFASQMKSAYDRTIAPVIRFLSDKISSLKTTFGKAVEAIGKAWDGLKSVAKKPVKFVIDVINALIGAENGKGGGFNKLAKAFGTSIIHQIPIPKILQGAARGGILAGQSSWMHGDSLLMPVRPGEGWTVSEALTDPYERARLLGLNKAALRGESAAQFRAGFGEGMARGGITWPTNTHRLSGNYRGHSGVDIAAGMGAPIWAAKGGRIEHAGYGRGFGQAIFLRGPDGYLEIYGHSSRLRTHKGATVGQGARIGDVGATGNATGPHLHFEIAKSAPGTASNRAFTLNWLKGAVDGGGGGGGAIAAIIDWVGRMKSALTKPLNRLKELAANPFTEAISKLPHKLADAAIAKARDWLKVGTGDLSSGFGTKGSNRERGRSLMLQMGFPASQWPALEKLWNGESGWNERAENRSSGAYGIPQALPGVKMASVGADWRVNPNTQIMWGLKYIKDRYGSPAHAYSAWLGRSPHWYSSGVNQAQRGWAMVGERQPELVNFRGGEQVAASRRQASEIFGNSGPQEIRGTLDLGNGLVGYVSGIIGDVVDRRDRASANRANLIGVS